HRRHGDAQRAVGVTGGNVDPDSGHSCLGGRSKGGEHAQGGGDLAPRIGEHRERQLVLFLGGERLVGFLGADGDQGDTTRGELWLQLFLVRAKGDVAVRTPRTAVEHHHGGAAGARRCQGGRAPKGVEQVTVRHGG